MATKNVALTKAQRDMLRSLLADFCDLCVDVIKDAHIYGQDEERVRAEMTEDLNDAKALYKLLK